MSDAKPPKGNKARINKENTLIGSASAQEIEMVNTGDTEIFARKESFTNNENERQLAKPKGEQTRTAMAEVLASKLKIDDAKNKDLNELI